MARKHWEMSKVAEGKTENLGKRLMLVAVGGGWDHYAKFQGGELLIGDIPVLEIKETESSGIATGMLYVLLSPSKKRFHEKTDGFEYEKLFEAVGQEVLLRIEIIQASKKRDRLRKEADSELIKYLGEDYKDNSWRQQYKGMHLKKDVVRVNKKPLAAIEVNFVIPAAKFAEAMAVLEGIGIIDTEEEL